MKLIACIAPLLLQLAACASVPETATAKLQLEPPTTRIAATLALAPLIDARPAAWRTSHVAALSKYTGLVLTQFAFGTGRTDGPLYSAGSDVDLRINGQRGALLQQTELFVRSVLTGAGATVGAAAPVDLKDVTRAAAGRPDGIVVVPILDQLDAFKMKSEDTMIGGSSHTDSLGRRVETSGFTHGTATTESYANLRLRLVLLDVRGGRVARQAVAYIATSGRGIIALDHAAKAAVEPMAAQVAAFVAFAAR